MPQVLISQLQFSFDFNLRFYRQMRCQLIICDLFHQGLFHKNYTNLLLKGVAMEIFFSQRSKRLQTVKNNYYSLDFNDFQKVNIFSGSRLFSTPIILS